MASAFTHAPKIILGSSSASRQAILSEMGFEFEVVKAGIDEQAIRRDSPHELVAALSKAKAEAVVRKLSDAGRTFPPDSFPHTVLLTADQVVLHDGIIREKPESAEQAREFISGYSLSPPKTVGAVMATNLNTGFAQCEVDEAEIHFRPIPDDVISTLIEDGSVFYCAGGLMVEHPLVVPYVARMVGPIDSVMGLSKCVVQRLLQAALSSHSSA